MSRPKISVIVPVYKAETYLCRCVDSILSQTFEDFELLLIDDGSPDRSGEICDEYAKRDCRVRVFHKENGGVSSARQCGLDNAKGEYVIHADPDDWIEKEMYERMYEVAIKNNADIVGCDFVLEFSEQYQRVSRQPLSENSLSCIRLFFEEKLHSGCCNKLIIRKLFEENKISFPRNVNLWEDMSTIPRVFYYARNIKYVPSPFYHYVQYNPHSYTKSKNSSVLTQKIEAIKILDDFFEGTILSYYLNYLKLSVRLSAISTLNYSNVKRYRKMYPEANKCILSHHGISIYNKIILCSGCIGGFILYIMVVVKRILSILKRWSDLFYCCNSSKSVSLCNDLKS